MKEVTREPITHDIKIYPEFFSAICTGVKRTELRKNDRDYRVGDTLHLMETPRGSCHRTGEFINVKIIHIADVGEWMPGYVLLSVELQEPRKAAMDSETYCKERKLFCSTDTARMRKAISVSAGTDVAHPAPVIPGWIPVSERMPEIRKHWLDVTVIIAISGEKYGSEALYCSDGNFRWGRDEPPIEDVTHWMPLPAAPQEGKP